MLVIPQYGAQTALFCDKIVNAIAKKARRLAWELVIRIHQLHYPWNHRGGGPQDEGKTFGGPENIGAGLQGFELIPKFVTGALFVDGEKKPSKQPTFGAIHKTTKLLSC
jgi:hypothetical protein